MTKPLDQETLDHIKKQGYWKEGDITYVIKEYEYPHDEECGESMCWCAAIARKENPEKYQKWREKINSSLSANSTHSRA